MDPIDTSRRYFLDWLRIAAFGLLVLYHVGMYYVSWDWHIKSPNASTLLEPWMRLFSPWRMDLLFLISGAATTLLLARRSAHSEVLATRLRFLMLPLAFGMLVIVPPQAYLEVVQRFGYSGGYLDFMRLYLKGDSSFCRTPGHCLILPTWNHLWYLPYMALYTLVLWAGLHWGSSRLGAAARALPFALNGARLLWVPIALLLSVRLGLGSRFPPTHSLVNDWALHAEYLPIFLLGALLAHTPQMWGRFVRIRRLALGLALVGWGVLLALSNSIDGTGALLRALAFSTQQWCGLVAAVGFAARYLDRDHPMRRYLTEAIFPLYVFHQTVIIVLAHAMAAWRLMPPVEASLLLVSTIVFSLLGVEGARRVNWARPLVGLRDGLQGQGRSPAMATKEIVMKTLHSLVLALVCVSLAGCGFLADQTSPRKLPSKARSRQALNADAQFWATLHSGDYDGIGKALDASTAAYLKDPGDAATAAHVGWLHIWKLAESARIDGPPATITDHAVLARRYFQEAVALDPSDARYSGFLASALLAEGSIHKDERLTRQGYYRLLDSIDAWPEFNLFTGGYTMSGQPVDSPRFKQGLDWLWTNLDACIGTKIDRRNPDMTAYMGLATVQGSKRVCWNSWIAPHNFEGFFLSMGDMLTKAGDWQTAGKVYANAKLSPTYASWKFAPALQARIDDAKANVGASAGTGAAKVEVSAANRASSTFACMRCHEG